MENNRPKDTQPNKPTYQPEGINQNVSLPPPQFTQANQKGMFMGRLNRAGYLLSIVYANILLSSWCLF